MIANFFPVLLQRLYSVCAILDLSAWEDPGNETGCNKLAPQEINHTL